MITFQPRHCRLMFATIGSDAACECPSDGLPALNPCPRHDPAPYALYAAKHRADVAA